MVQLLALDLDDTLLRADLTISDRNRKSLRAAEDQGVRIVLASGRTVFSMERFADDLGFFDRPGFLIADNGSTVAATLPRALLVQHTLDKNLLRHLLQAFEVLDLPVQVYREKAILVTKDNAYVSADVRLTGFDRFVVPDLADHLDFNPTKIVVPGDPEVLPTALGVIRAAFGDRVNAFISKPYFLEVLPVQADKGSALRYVAQTLGVPREEVMAIGDAENDLGMIQYAGWGVAMANGTDQVRQAARIVSHHGHEQDGVAEIVDAYVLKKA